MVKHEEDTTTWSSVWWPFDIFTLPISDGAKVTLLKAMEHTTPPEEDGRGIQSGAYGKCYPTTAWLAERRGLSPRTIERHTKQIRKALGGLW